MTENNPPRRLWRTLRSIMLNLLIILAAILALDWYRAPDSVAIANLPALTSSDGNDDSHRESRVGQHIRQP